MSSAATPLLDATAADRVGASHREPISWRRFGALLAAIAVCGAARWVIAGAHHWAGASIALIAGAIAAAVLLGPPPAQAWEAPLTVPALRHRRSGSLVAALGFTLFAYAIVLLYTRWLQDFTVAAPLAVAGIAVWGAGLAMLEARAADRVVMPSWELWAFAALVVLAFFLRLYRLDYFPPPDGFCAVEEPQAGLVTHHILYEGQRPWEFLLDRWLPVPTFLLLGETPYALRLPFAIVSALTVIPFHLLVRQLVSRPAALLATALFTVCRWNLLYARLAHNIFATTFIVVLILALCVRAHRSGRLALFPWIGFLSAYTMYTYAGYRGTTLFVGLFFLISILQSWRSLRHAVEPEAVAVARRRVRWQMAGFALAAIAYIGTVAPLVAQLRNDPAYFVEAANRSLSSREYYGNDWQTTLRLRWLRILRTAEIFNHVGDDSATFNMPGATMLDPISGVLFTIALAYSVVWWRRRFHGFFAFMLLLLLVLGTLFVQNLDIRRLQGIVPLIFVLVAFTADRFGQLTLARIGRAGRGVLVATGLAVAALAFVINYRFYFVLLMNDLEVRGAFQNRHTVLVRYLHTLPDNAYAYMISDTLNVFIPSDFTWWRGDRVPGRVSSDLLPLFTGQTGPWTGRDLRLVIQEPFAREALVHLLQACDPAVRCEPSGREDDPRQVRFTACTLPGAVCAGFDGGVQATYYRGDSATPLLTRVEPVINDAFLPDECRYPKAVDKPPCRAEWSGTWQVAEGGMFQLRSFTPNGTVETFIDGKPLTVPMKLDTGPHAVRVRAAFASIEEAGVRLDWRDPASGAWEPVPLARWHPRAPQ